MINVDIAAIIAAMTWWHLLWVAVASFAWTFSSSLAEAFVSTILNRGNLIGRRRREK